MATLALDQAAAPQRVGISRANQRRLWVLAVMLADALALAAAFALAFLIRFYSHLPLFDEVQPSPELHLRISLILIPAWMAVYAMFRLYNYHYLLGGTQEYARVFNAGAVALSLVILFTFFFPIIRISRGWITLSWAAAFVCVTLSRFVMRRAAYALRRRGYLTWRTLIVGTDEEAAAIGEQLRQTPTAGAEVVGFVQNHIPVSQRIDEKALVGGIDQLPALVQALGIEQLIVSTAALRREDLINIFQKFAISDEVDLRFSSGLYELYTAGVQVKEIGSVPLVSMNKVRLDAVETAIKSVMDRTLSLIGLAVLAPLFAVVAILIKLDSPGPVIYRRRVLGQGGRPFDAYKFRTMYVNGHEILQQRPELADELKQNFKLKDDPRVTRLGRRLRRLSFDELPQLANVLRGQMSLVGPRMITPEEAAQYGKLRMNLLTVKPGLTGWWQIKGRSDVPYEERVRLDMYYIRNYSVWLDLQILLQTLPAVVRGRGAY